MATLFGSTPSTKRGGSTLFGGTTSGNDMDRLLRSIENAETRIKDAGFKVEDSDRRNWFERAVNLPEGQNAFFDALELLGRPGQAIMNPVLKTLQGETDNIAQSAWRGLSGQDRVRGTDIAEELGVESGPARFAAGLGIEVLTDPLNVVPAGKIANVAGSALRSGGNVAKRGYTALESMLPRMEEIRTQVVQPRYEKVRDTLGYMFNPEYKQTETLTGGQSDAMQRAFRETENRRNFLQEEYLNNTVDLARRTGLDKGDQVGRVMEADLRQFEDVKGYEFPDGVRRTDNKSDLFEEIGTKRQEIKDVSRGIWNEQQQYDTAIREFARGIDQTDQEIRKMFSQIERVNAKQLDKQTKANLREATREIQRIQSQLNNFGQNEASMLKHFKRLVRQQHEMNFDLARQVRQAAPNGIKGVSRDSLPPSLKNIVRESGKGIDELANELGYTYADDLLRDLSRLNTIPRRLDDAEVERLARQEMMRTGALRSLEQTRQGLEATKGTLASSIREIGKTDNAARAEQQALLDIENNPRYQELMQQRETLKQQKDTLFGEASEARQARLDQIKALEGEIGALRDSSRNPVIIQREIERVAREMPKNPAIQNAARELMRNNEEIRTLAESEGIPISELEGYMTHIWSKAERTRRKNQRGFLDMGRSGQPNKSILKQRTLTGSAEDINERIGRDFFEPNAFFASAIGQKRLIDYIHSLAFRKQVLNDPNFAMPYEEFKRLGQDLPKNAVVINTNNYKFIKESGDILEGIANKDIGGEYVVTKAAKLLLDRYQKAASDEGTRAFLRAYDMLLSGWKRAALFSIPYHIRNDVGAKFNNWVGGMPIRDIVKYSAQADRDVFNAMARGKETPLYREFRQQGLGASSQAVVEFARSADPEDAIQKVVERQSKSRGGRALDAIKPQNWFDTSQKASQFIDQTNRFALYKWARDKGLSPEEAAKKVRQMQFDYTNTTQFERNVMARIFPFYRWIRNNLPYQIQQFINDPRKYANLNKVRLNAQSSAGIEEEQVPDYMKEGFYVPVTQDKMLGFNLPLGDLGKLSDPLKMGTDALSTIIKLPLELSTNFNFFYQKPIEQFEGQEKQFTLFGRDLGGIPMKTAYAAEQLTGQIGRGLSGYLQKPETEDQDTKFRMPSLGISGILKDFDVEKANLYELYDRLNQLQDYIDYIEQQTGVRPRGVNEINRPSSSTLFGQ